MPDYSKRTSTSDLYALLEKLKITGVHICRLAQVPAALSKGYRSLIINLDSEGPGSHWVALDTKKKMYFDSYAQPMPREIPKGYTSSSTHKQLQSLDGTACGGLCCLWLYYVRNYSNDDYYKIFKDVYAGF